MGHFWDSYWKNQHYLTNAIDNRGVNSDVNLDIPIRMTHLILLLIKNVFVQSRRKVWQRLKKEEIGIAQKLAEVLGHQSLSMVKRYAHLSDSHTAMVVKRMNEELLDENSEMESSRRL